MPARAGDDRDSRAEKDLARMPACPYLGHDVLEQSNANLYPVN